MKRSLLLLSLVAASCAYEPTLPAVDHHLEGLTLEAPGTSFPSDSALQLKAWAHYSDGSRVDVTAQTTWTSSHPSVGVIGPTGIVTFSGVGATKLEGTFEGRVVSITLFSTAATLESLTVSTLARGELAKGDARAFYAWANYSDGTRLEVTEHAFWSVDGQVLTLGDQPGRVVGSASGTGTVSVSFRGIESGAFVVVGAARATQLTVSVPNAIFRPGEAQQLAAKATFSDGTTRDVSTEAVWTSSDLSRVTFGAQTGSIVAVSVGTSRVGVSWAGLTATTMISVQARRLTALAFADVALFLAHGNSGRVALMGTWDDGTREDVSELALWWTSAPRVATVLEGDSSAGTVISHGEGGATITAALGAFTARLQVAVTAPVLVSLTATLEGGRLAPGQEASFTVMGHWSDGVVINLSNEVALSHGDELLTSVRGDWIYARGAELGYAPLVFEFAGFRSSVEFEVSLLHIVEVRVVQDPIMALPADSSGHRMAAYARYADGLEADVTELASWTLVDPSVAQLSDEPGSRGRVTLTVGGTTDLNVTINQWLVTRAMNFAPSP